MTPPLNWLRSVPYTQQPGIENLCFGMSFDSQMAAISKLLLTYLHTPWSRVLLEKLTGSAASQEIPRILWNP
jgi:hypothetical protein